MRDEATFRVKAGLAEMLKGGVIMDVVTPEQAKIAEDAGAAAVMALERVPADIRRDGGVARMSDPVMIKGIQEAVTIPVMAKARIGHFAEAQVLEALEVDYVDESEVLTPADEANHIDKWAFKVPFVCGATNLGEALRRIGEGAAMIRSKGEAGTGDIVEAVRHMRAITGEIRGASSRWPTSELATAAKEHAGAARPRARRSPRAGKLPVVAVLRRRDRDARGRVADDAARRRGRVRRLGHLQVARIRSAARARDRRGDDALRGSRARRRAPRTASARRWSASRPPSSRTSSCSPSAAGRPRAGGRAGRRRPRPPGRLRGARARAARAGRGAARGARARRPRRARRAGDPRRRVDDDDAGIEREGLAEPLRELRAAGTPVLGTCAGLIMLDRDHLGLMDIVARRNAFGRQVRSFEADLDVAGIEGGPVRAVFIRAPWVAEHGDGGRGAGERRRPPGRGPRGRR